ncbi:adenosylmethionine decarboxylase [Actibacterium sp. 188UL27-1]|uniref:adenosylmethionine decarboxylase n=1 Tax=Actibacterium sp. 188UL27-1 TaxID=2786961 RepID=UPI00195A860E|nr:adenosylmethionine decarboxylase [Actibacterium sp. 188UL27-1]MBM7067400.1 adenosylmethionine decarboxylase [Actibacterium sp. 188UL27-1]
MNSLANNSFNPDLCPHPLGQHVIAEFYHARNLEEVGAGETALRSAAEAVGAHVLDVRGHDFGERAGFTAVALLAESHISVHTWPEHGYAAIDIFMCGPVDITRAVDALKAHFQPGDADVTILKRGSPDRLTNLLAADAKIVE